MEKRKLTMFIIFHASITIGQFTYEDDTRILTFRHQGSVWLDTSLAYQFDSMLVAIRSENVSVEDIHARPTFSYVLFYLMTDSSFNSWNNHNLLTGDPYLDSLTYLYPLLDVSRLTIDTTSVPGDTLTLYYFHTSEEVQTIHLANLYEQHPNILYGWPSGPGTDGDQIFTKNKNDQWLIVFSNGAGDCMAGCMYRDYWYYSVDNPMNFEFEEYVPLNSPQVKLHRWNIPFRFPMSMFDNADSIFTSITTSQEWWIRVHAIRGMSMIIKNGFSGFGEDDSNQINILYSELTQRLPEVISIIESQLNDPDPDIVLAAENALDQLSGLDLEQEEINPHTYYLSQNYPNPFNTTTTIEYKIGQDTNVYIDIYNLVGHHIYRLVSEYQIEGRKKIRWDGNDKYGIPVASGIYIYQMKIEGRITSKKLIFLK